MREHVDLVGDSFGIEEMGVGKNQKWVRSVQDAILSGGVILKSFVEKKFPNLVSRDLVCCLDSGLI